MTVIDVGLAIVTKDMLVNGGYVPTYMVKNMALIVVMVGGAKLNSAAFSYGNALLSVSSDKERNDRDEAQAKMQSARRACAMKRKSNARFDKRRITSTK